MSGSFRFEALSGDGALPALRPVWNALLDASPSDTVFLTWEWMDSWWRSYGRGRELHIVVARRDGDVVGLLPVTVAPEPWKRILRVRTLRLLGDGSYDSDYLDFIARTGLSEELVPALWTWLKRGSGVRFDVARLSEMPALSPHVAALRPHLARQGDLLEEERVRCVYTPLPDRWETLLASFKPRMRTKVRSLRRNLEAAHAVRLLRCGTLEEADRRLPSLFDLHARRWERRGRPGVFGGAAKRTFYHEASRALLERGWLQFYTLEVDGEAVAHQYCMGYKGTMYLLQEGFEPSWEEKGVGNVLRAMVLERAIAEGFRTYDFLAGATEHKLSWAGQEKESVRLAGRGPGLMGLAASGLAGLGRALEPLRGGLRRGGKEPRGVPAAGTDAERGA